MTMEVLIMVMSRNHGLLFERLWYWVSPLLTGLWLWMFVEMNWHISSMKFTTTDMFITRSMLIAVLLTDLCMMINEMYGVMRRGQFMDIFGIPPAKTWNVHKLLEARVAGHLQDLAVKLSNLHQKEAHIRSEAVGLSNVAVLKQKIAEIEGILKEAKSAKNAFWEAVSSAKRFGYDVPDKSYTQHLPENTSTSTV